MLYAALGSFIIAALIGAIMLTGWTQKKRPASALVYAHGTFAVLGFILLIVQAVSNPDAYPKTSLIFFALAAVGGSYLLYNDLTKQHVPVPVALIHGALAVTAIVMLLMYVA